ncbi:GNAT family N-acetyltransferase [Agromyces sp. LHK192]|uniref:GNAT family N-acetyltransferase n=1 Tax=Agromyces sp. LHK192 TaxID=2498704 RepID=UPI000FDA72D6|nr:GNAT family N-acetyltransferase [Agromyces sp. LHK192]
MPELVIRAAAADDAERIAVLAAATFPLACPPSTTPEAQQAFIAEHLSAERFAAYVGDPERAVLVAEASDGAMLGYAMLIAGDPSDADVAAAVAERPAIELSKFYASPTVHGAGVAASLMQAVVDVARATGATVCWLGVNEENERAQRFYAKHGFRQVGRKRFRLGDRWEDDHVLALPL